MKDNWYQDWLDDIRDAVGESLRLVILEFAPIDDIDREFYTEGAGDA